MFYSAAVFFLLLFFWYYSRTRTMSLLKRCGIPGPKPNLIFGNVFQMAKMPDIEYQKHLLQTYGRVVGYYTGAHPTVLLSDKDLIKNILITDFKNFPDRPPTNSKFLLFEKQNEGSLITYTGHHWTNTRKFITPSFTPSRLKSMTPLIEESVNTFVDIIGKNAETGVEFNFYPLSQKLVAELFMKTAFGIENNIQNNTKVQHHQGREEFEDLQDIMATRMNKSLYLLINCFPWLIPLTQRLRRLAVFSRNSVVRLSKSISQIIKLRRADLPRNDIMQVLISSTTDKDNQEKSLTENEIIANAMHLYVAAYETTSIMIANIAHHLVNYPEVQDKVRKEVNELYESEGKLDFNGVFTGLEYLDCVIKETLRLYPPVVSFVSRNCLQDYKYKDITIPKGSTVLVATYPLHHDEEYWPNPEIFDPMRFSKERKHEIFPSTFQGFGDGPRNCIGTRLAYLDMKLCFAKLLLKYKLESGPNTEIGELSPTFTVATICPKFGVYIKASKI